MLNRASSMVGESVLETDDGLVNTILLVPRLILPEKVVAGRVVGHYSTMCYTQYSHHTVGISEL